MTRGTTTLTLNGRTLTGALLLFLGLALAGLILFGLLPAMKARRDAIGEIGRLEADLARLQPAPPEESLAAKAAREAALRRALQAEREQWMAKVRTFRDERSIGEVLPPARSGRIDFKVALYHARARLEEKAQARGVRIPVGLGMPEELEEEERAEKRLWQLASVVMLVDRLMDLGVPVIESIATRDPMEVLLEDNPEGARMEIYPVEVVFQTTDVIWRAALRSLRDVPPFFSVRRVEMVCHDPLRPNQLKVRAVFGAILHRTGPPPPPEGEAEPERNGLEGTAVNGEPVAPVVERTIP